MTHEHTLGGCTPTPLAHYLKALGILRLVAEQKDPHATGRWHGEQFILRTALSWEELEWFFLEEYIPTPIVAPWNGGSGFFPNDNKNGIDTISVSTTERLRLYKEVITLSRSYIAELEESPKKEDKTTFLHTMRAILPDSVLTWFDAAVMLSTEKPGYPPLLGTGGNDGRLDFTNNFMQRVTDLFSPEDGNPTAQSIVWLRGSVSAVASPGLVSKAIGQFSPGNAGGPNSTAGFNSDSLINPWDFVLMLEGALLFAGTTTRRLESNNPSVLSYPFTVRTTGTGTGSSSVTDESQSRSRAEIWLPLWHKDINLYELRSLLSEGRVTVGRRPARDGLDFARAVSSYGVDRGISSFQRYAFLMRSGKAYLATPIARIQVIRNPKTDRINDLDKYRWLESFRRFARSDTAPGSIRQLARRLEDEIFALTQGGGHIVLQNILSILGQIQSACANSSKSRDAVLPIPVLGPQWTIEADDGSNEFRLACAFAGVTSMRNYLFPLKTVGRRTEWDAGSAKAVWSGGDLISNLLRVLDRKLIEAQRNKEEDQSLSGHPVADLSAVMAFLNGETNDERIAGLLAGLANVDLPQWMPDRQPTVEQPPAVFSLMKPLFTPDSVLRQINLLPSATSLSLPREIVTLLKTGNKGQVGKSIEIAWRRLRIAGLNLPTYPLFPPDLVGIDSRRLAAALMVPLANGDFSSICKPFRPAQKAEEISLKED